METVKSLHSSDVEPMSRDDVSKPLTGSHDGQAGSPAEAATGSGTISKPYKPDGSANLVAGRRKAGRPPNPMGSTASRAQAMRVARAKTKLIMERAGELGLEAIAEARVPLRTDAPERTVTQAKEAALRLLNAMLWTIEQRAATEGVNEYDEARVLKLLAGLNAALPKQAETPQKDPSEMTEEELRRLAGK